MATQKGREDRRVQRTRQVLQQAFVDVMREKGEAHRGLWGLEKSFAATSTQEITTRANVNRGTFYLHFPDKYMLADAVVRQRFHQQLASALPPEPRWDSQDLAAAHPGSLERPRREVSPPTAAIARAGSTGGTSRP